MAKLIEKKTGTAGDLYEALLFVSKAMEKKDLTRAFMMNKINFSRGEEGGRHEDKIFIAATDGRRLHIVWFPADGNSSAHSEWDNHPMGSYSVKVNVKEIIILKPEDVVYPNWRKIISEDAVVQPSQQIEWTALSTADAGADEGKPKQAKVLEHEFDPKILSESLYALSTVGILVNHKFVEDLGINSFSVFQYLNEYNRAVLFSQQRSMLAKTAVIMPMQKDYKGRVDTFLKRPEPENKETGNTEEAEELKKTA
jgi:hypothetical protein